MTTPQQIFSALQLLRDGTPLLAALENAATAVSGTPLEVTVRAIIGRVRDGETLSAAMARHAAFSREQVALVRVGEVGGVMDRAVARIVELMSTGRLPATPALLSDATQRSLLTWSLGCLLDAGVPVLEALDVAAGTVADEKLCQGIRRVRDAVRSGSGMAEAMVKAPAVFPTALCKAVSGAEEIGDLGRTLMRLADEAPATATVEVPAQESESESKVRQIANAILLQSIKDKATDIHFDPADEQPRIRYRIDGTLYEMLPPPADLFRATVNRLKIMADMDIAQTRLPQTGRILLKVNNDTVDIRASTVPVLYGERLVLRVLRRDALMGLEAMFADDVRKLQQFRSLLSARRGLIVCAGPSGSGKTTLLYALVKELNQPGRCIISIEDPVEFTLAGVAQIPVAPQAGMTFANAMRSVLRQDPDVIVIGEIRDIETLQACVVAANTGHLVIASLHASSAPDAVKRMLDAGLEPFLLNGSLHAVIAQRLARCLCKECRQAAELPVHSMPGDAVQTALKEVPSPAYYRPGTCHACHETGHRGRTAVNEVLTLSDPLRRAIAGRDLSSIREAALASGMEPMLVDAIRKAARGQISTDEVLQFAAEAP